jgi:23S rRNA pseudouridine1911/1915/1917 synthase
MSQILTVAAEQVGLRLDRFLQAALKDFSRTDIQKIIVAGQVLSAGQPVPKNLRMELGMAFEVLALPEKAASELLPENIPLDIVYEDDDIVVLNKPRNLVVHPGSGVHSGTLAAGLLYHFKNQLSQINGPLRPGIVHRLDKDTPGLMVVAKNDHAHKHLVAQLESRELERTYQALIWGHTRDQEGVVDAPLDRDPHSRIKISVQPDGKAATTHYKVMEYYHFAALLELKLETGRTHQIRVHMRHMGHPVVGDPLYDGRDVCLNRTEPLERDLATKLLEIAPAQLLQAVKLSLIHPTTGERLTFKAPLEKPFAKALALLRKECKLHAPSYNPDAFRLFDAPLIHAVAQPEPIVTYEEEEEEEDDGKVRPTRAERYAKTKQRRARQKEILLEKAKKKAEKDAIKKGEFVAWVEPGRENPLEVK